LKSTKKHFKNQRLADEEKPPEIVLQYFDVAMQHNNFCE
jgi:hypothetical protein